jgi:lipoyl(octanoyl) transferase
MLVPPRPGAENMARDAGLMDRARETGEAVFSVYSWERPTLSLGRNQTASGRYDLEQISERSIDVVRRPTGGRALLHWHEVTYSVTAPMADVDSLKSSYERINRILLDGLSRLGVGVSESRGGTPTPSPGELPCFAAPAEGELIVNGAKLVGSAQYREAGALLQHGSILIEDDQPMIASLLKRKSNNLHPPRAATLTDALRREPSVDEVAAALFESVRSLEDEHATLLDDAETNENTARHIAGYQNELWTWRR